MSTYYFFNWNLFMISLRYNSMCEPSYLTRKLRKSAYFNSGSGSGCVFLKSVGKRTFRSRMTDRNFYFDGMPTDLTRPRPM